LPRGTPRARAADVSTPGARRRPRATPWLRDGGLRGCARGSVPVRTIAAPRYDCRAWCRARRWPAAPRRGGCGLPDAARAGASSPTPRARPAHRLRWRVAARPPTVLRDPWPLRSLGDPVRIPHHPLAVVASTFLL